jgi:DNA-binding PadR family transcriptional regulator
MSSTTRLLVLGVVRIFQPVHGYEVRRELVSWRAQEWASVKPGSIYNALNTLTHDGYLEIVGTDQVGGRPERTTYRLTPGGEEEFRILLREEWWTVRPPIDPLMAAISFIGYVSRNEAIAALEHRTAQIRGFVRHLEFATDALDGVDSPYHVREMHRLMNARISSEIGWAEQFIARLRSGEYATADDPPWQPAPPRPAPPPSPRGRKSKAAVAGKPHTTPAPTAPAPTASAPTAPAPIARKRAPREPAPTATGRDRVRAPREPRPPATDRDSAPRAPAPAATGRDRVRAPREPAAPAPAATGRDRVRAPREPAAPARARHRSRSNARSARARGARARRDRSRSNA